MAYTYSIDATVETSKNGNGGTVNLRKTASAKGEVVEKIKSGTKVKVDTLAGNWLPTKHGTKTGYIMAEFIAESDVYKGTSSGGETGGGSVGTGTLTYGKVNKSSGYLNIRKTPSTSGEILGRLYDKDSLKYYDGEEHTGNGYSWYRIEFDGTAYVQARFVVKDTTDDHTVLKDNIFDYDPDAAQEYAWNHTETTNADKTSNYNTKFGFLDNDCANFVSQCLCAGGLPMFETWSNPSIDEIPSGWNNSNWKLTNRLRCALIAKGRIERVNMDQVKKGDIIYNYNSSASDVHYRYPHVVLAAKDYDSVNKSCVVHGHTDNKRDYIKKMDDESKFRCYHVVKKIKVENCEKRILMPKIGNGGSVIS